MNELMIFKNPEFGEMRIVEYMGEQWFVAADVCRALDIANPTDAISRLDEDEHTLVSIEGASNGRPVNAVNEAGLYGLVLGSRKPEAKAFKRWIKHEVLPSIRKHGAYMTPETLEAALLNPDTIIKIATALKEEQDKRKALEIANSALTVDNAVMKPKADYFDELVDRNLLTNFRETAKELHVGPKAFVSFLLERKYIYRDKKGKLTPYQQYVDSGLFELRETFNEKTQWSGTQTMITPKGRETFRLLCLGAKQGG